MKRLTLQLEFVTPCFLGGADRTSAPEWRGQSIRGQLRWWYRAVAGAASSAKLDEVKSAEGRLFGVTDRRSPLRLAPAGAPGFWPAKSRWPLDLETFRVSAQEIADANGAPADPATLQRLRINNPQGRERPTDPLQFLGYGCIEYQGGDRRGLYLSRPCFAPGQRASLELSWPEPSTGRVPDASWQDLGRALWAWIHLGGIGSRTRNGFGSVACVGVEGDLPGGDLGLGLTPDLKHFQADAAQLLDYGCGRPQGDWTHLSSGSRILVGKRHFRTWAGAMRALGTWVLYYRRRYGMPSDPGRGDSFTYGDRDYVWAQQAGAGEQPPVALPDKAGFGLPLLFDRQAASVTWTPTGDDSDREDRRRASPVLLHVARLGEETYLPVVTYLPARLVPEGAELRFRRRVNRRWTALDTPRQEPTPEHTEVVTRFLDFLAGHVAQEVQT